MRHYLMVRPAYFDVEYSINPWMDPGKPTDTRLAITQWEWLRDLYVELGHRVDLLDPVPGLPDMVYAANGATVVNGRALVARFRILAGSGFRTDPRAHDEATEFFGLPVVGLTLTDPRYYHLDTALTVLDDDLIMYLPEAFAEDSRRLLKELYPDAVIASSADAAAFGLTARLRERGFEPIGADLSELLKGGGSVKCCTLELRPAA
ncbi:dimethylarginine dimethylaminohydrolase family protein [Amycolatopsis speibonae]|uniref:Dimethylarginine dimethylaminohydrolase family protein n=1 Tax=Amycolatopsis speibonae TaxID=1450224 RepID=A0ABV7P330_9PSEU